MLFVNEGSNFDEKAKRILIEKTNFNKTSFFSMKDNDEG